MTPLERVRERVYCLKILADNEWKIFGEPTSNAKYSAYAHVLELIDYELELAKNAARATPRCPVDFEEGEG